MFRPKHRRAVNGGAVAMLLVLAALNLRTHYTCRVLVATVTPLITEYSQAPRSVKANTRENSMASRLS